MFGAKAYGERFGFYINATFMQHLKGIARAVANGQYDMASGQYFTGGKMQRTNFPVFNFDIVHALAETDFTAQRFNAGTHGFNHGHQLEGADMRLAHIEDFFRCASLHELREYLAAMMLWVLDLAIEFAV